MNLCTLFNIEEFNLESFDSEWNKCESMILPYKHFKYVRIGKSYTLTENAKRNYDKLYATDSLFATSVLSELNDSYVFSKDIFLNDFFRSIKQRRPNVREEVYSIIVNETRNHYSGEATIDYLDFFNDIRTHFRKLSLKNGEYLNDIWFEAYSLIYSLLFETRDILSYIKSCFAERILYNEVLALLQLKKQGVICCSLWLTLFEFFDLISTGKSTLSEYYLLIDSENDLEIYLKLKLKNEKRTYNRDSLNTDRTQVKRSAA
ncbi:MAG: hypothetical protein CVU05_09020 [Bacteroidetes bacterium HGW-Bacteroidetes-21]|jgi:hypothetical protein|nr:MAG: hypothetical protein CVU05_09020 [Bacteroidetes bacterium HGW-Bacteroidetes-21]